MFLRLLTLAPEMTIFSSDMDYKDNIFP
jgi:hypothetical protein